VNSPPAGVVPPKAKVGAVEAGGGAGGDTGGGVFGTGAAPLLAPNMNSPPAGGVVPPKAKVGVVVEAPGSIFLSRDKVLVWPRGSLSFHVGKRKGRGDSIESSQENVKSRYGE
jgi:hypothetical protein